MKPYQPLFLSILVFALLGLIVFMPALGARFHALIGPRPVPVGDVARLAAENVSLGAQLALLQAVKAELPSSTKNLIPALVYSTYPFNLKNEITVNAGSAEGVSAGNAVLFEGNLIGVVASVTRGSSVVQTIFDPNFRLPVRIGSQGYSALLVGGSYPIAESIPKTAAVAPGDVVMSVATSVPYGMAIGTVQSVSLASNNLFEQAKISFPYDMSMIQAVTIVP